MLLNSQGPQGRLCALPQARPWPHSWVALLHGLRASLQPACPPAPGWVGPGRWAQTSVLMASHSLRVRQSFHITNSSLVLEFNNKIQTGTTPQLQVDWLQILTEVFS